MASVPNFVAQLRNKSDVYEVARMLGFVQTRGGRGYGGKGNGNPSEMLEAIGGGLAIVVNVASDEEYHFAEALFNRADAIAGAAGVPCEDFINRVALALKSAQKQNAA